nr:DDE-type integrase/transposase/recombinase [Nitrospirota bacterium]
MEFLSDNGQGHTSHRFHSFVRVVGLIPCHTPRRSPESNGLAEAFFESFKRDYAYQACLAFPFVLSPSPWLRAGVSKRTHRVFPQPARESMFTPPTQSARAGNLRGCE